MIVLLDTPTDLDEAQRELGCPVEQLLTPLTRRKRKHPGAPFVIDNGAFANFDPAGFTRLLSKHADAIAQCRFVAVPDVVGSAIRTLEVWKHWAPKLKAWPLAFVAQDGIENHPIPWDECTALFVGGSTAWKVSPHAAACVKAAKAMGKWVHIGRVNTPGRFEYFEAMGADSCDGTGLARYSHMREAIHQNATAPKLL